MLSKYFEVPKDFWTTEEPEAVIIAKNKKISRLSTILKICIIVVLLAVSSLFIMDIFYDDFGLTSKSAAGSFADNPCIHTADYDIYYYTFGGEVGSGYEYIAGFRPVKQLLIGYATFERDYEYDALYVDNEQVGIIYSIKGKDGYYNIIRALNKIMTPVPSYFQNLDVVNVNGQTYEVELNSFFITDEPVKEFSIDNATVIVSEVKD